jgi:O-acetyl-ADP-ribose deacetylase (regulator of RNase III)
MEIIHKDGDIFKGSETFKVHQVNCKGAMGAGIAKQVRNDYPEVYYSYKKACEMTDESSKLLGMVQVVQTKKGFYIVNLFGQDDYYSPTGRCTNYEAFYTGLEKIKTYIIEKNLPKEIAFPCRIGSALAGGDWDVIYAMICSVFNNTDFNVVIYDFKR